MQRHPRFAQALVTLQVLLVATAAFAGTPVAVAQGPWNSVIYGADGGLLGARGREADHTPLRLDLARRSTAAGLLAVTRYGRGKDEVTIRRSYEAPETLRVQYEAGPMRLTLAAHQVNAGRETLLVYGLADGQVFSVWTSATGEILSGDVKALARALDEAGAVPELMRRYEEDRRPLRRHLPASGDEIFLAPERKGCDLDGGEYCGVECTWECRNAMCDMCLAVCRAGHRIACGR